MITLKCHFFLEEAKKRWISVEFIDKNIPLFFLKKGKKKILFKDTNGWINTALGRKLSKHKQFTYKIMEYYKIPFPKTILWNIKEKLDTYNIKKSLDYPMVVKPSDRWCWKGISIVFNKKQFSKAIYEAKKFWKNIIIQEFIKWHDHRIMVVWDKVVAWLKRIPPSIIGDGKHTIKELIKKKNISPERWDNCDTSILTKIRMDTVTKEYIQNTYWYTLQTIPRKHATVYLRGNSNLSTWWDATDVTDIIHPKFKKICIKIAKNCLCPIVGVDIMTPDISKDPSKHKRAMIEINSGAQFNIHETNIFGKPRNVSGAILDFYFKK